MNKVALSFVPDGGVTMDLGTPHCHWVNQRFQGGVSRMFGIAVARPTSAHHLLFNPLRAAACCVRDSPVEL